MSAFRPLIEEAVRLKGSQLQLAEAMGCSQQQISYLLQRAKRVSVEMAVLIEAATEGRVSRQALRPDVFGPPDSLSHQHAASDRTRPVPNAAQPAQEVAR